MSTWKCEPFRKRLKVNIGRALQTKQGGNNRLGWTGGIASSSYYVVLSTIQHDITHPGKMEGGLENQLVVSSGEALHARVLIPFTFSQSATTIATTTHTTHIQTHTSVHTKKDHFTSPNPSHRTDYGRTKNGGSVFFLPVTDC